MGNQMILIVDYCKSFRRILKLLNFHLPGQNYSCSPFKKEKVKIIRLKACVNKKKQKSNFKTDILFSEYSDIVDKCVTQYKFIFLFSSLFIYSFVYILIVMNVIESNTCPITTLNFS